MLCNTKISGLKICESLRIEHGFDAISLMPTNLYGPRDNNDSKIVMLWLR